MMIPFLYNVAKAYYKTYGNSVSRYTFVFPNQRAGVFFQHYLSQITKSPIFSPEILTVSDLFSKLSDLQKIDRIESLFILYDIYKRISNSLESFDEFHYWGEMLLNDFDDVDKYLVDAKQLFSNIQDIKEIDAGFSYLSEDQIEAVRRFWKSFLPIGENQKKKDFEELWKVLYPLYTEFKAILKSQNRAYEGMIFREVIDQMKSNENLDLPFEKIVFVGLNAHSESEQLFLEYLKKNKLADFYWDYSSPLVSDINNRASKFIASNRMKFPSELSLDPEELSLERPILEVVGIPSAVGQAKYVNQILSELITTENIASSNKAMHTALVLPDENLLLPVLYSIPKEIGKVNVTMGYNLQNSSISGLLDHIFELQHNVRFTGGKVHFYHKPVFAILNHRYITNIAKDDSTQLTEYIQKYNKIIIAADDLNKNHILSLIFKQVRDWKEFPEYLKNILSCLKKSLHSESENTNEDKELETITRYVDIEGEMIVEYYKTINKMQEALKGVDTEMSIDTYIKLLKKMIYGITVPFRGEPLSGLQIMGVLETRALDFENIIITSMNEGIFPLKRAANSFIPYNLRKGFGLPTYEHQDSIFAYHFYRMINRAKHIYLLYDTRTDGLQTGEVSRYFQQIKHLYPDHFEIKIKLATYKVTASNTIPISISKTPQIIQKMQQFLAGGDAKLSASSINTYLNCPLQFYFSKIENLEEVEEINESIEANIFGTIFHSIMEWVYSPFKGKLVTSDLLKNVAKDESYLTQLIERSFAKNYFLTPDIVRPLTGQNYLTGEVIRKYVKRLLAMDAKLTPFIYVASEKRLEACYPLRSGISVNLTGFIDRVDSVANHTRIIDYKTGKGVLKFSKMEDLFDKEIKDRPKAVMQVFMYAHMYLLEHPTEIVESGIYYLRNMYGGQFNTSVIYKPTSRDNIVVSDFSIYRDEFKVFFDKCLEEIFDVNTPFVQTPTNEACQWCNFTGICKK